jgi:phage protein D/phage baseplate assembly protein gpV
MPAQQVSNAFKIEIEGTPLSGVDLMRAEVEDHLHLPDAFTITIKDTVRNALSTANLKIGSKIKISVLSDASPGPVKLLQGEVTALEAEFHAGISLTIVRGYDESHRLFRGRTTASYLNMTYADIAKKVASKSLAPGQIDSTSPTYKHVAQSNESDWTFLSRLAQEVGYQVTVVDGKLSFAKPPESDSAPSDHDMTSDDPLSLMPGSNLLYLRTVVTAAEQVKEVEVRGWDPDKKQAVSSIKPAKTDAIKNGSSSAAVAGVFPAPSLLSNGMLLNTDKAVDKAAQALADRVAASQTEIEGQARGNPKLKAGAAIRLAQLGDPFDGRYVLTTTRHSYDPDSGYTTSFTVSGRVERSTLALAGGGGAGSKTTIEGVVPGIVDDVDDPDKLSRVRLRFPWMDAQYVSDWSRIVQVGAGAKRGLLVMPEVDDEVLVAFEQGDVGRAYVLGGLYNGTDKPEVGPGSLLDSASKKVNNRLFTSRMGHQLLFVDDQNGPKVVLQNSDKSLVITLDEQGKKVTIKSGGDLELTADQDIKLTATGNVKISANQNVELSGMSVKSEAQSQWSGKGATTSLEGTGPTSIKGQPIQLN